MHVHSGPLTLWRQIIHLIPCTCTWVSTSEGLGQSSASSSLASSHLYLFAMFNFVKNAFPLLSVFIIFWSFEFLKNNNTIVSHKKNYGNLSLWSGVGFSQDHAQVWWLAEGTGFRKADIAAVYSHERTHMEIVKRKLCKRQGPDGTRHAFPVSSPFCYTDST
jgi:hypothetical protein